MTAEQRPSCPDCGASAVTGTAVSTRPVVLAAQWQCGQGHTWLLESAPGDWCAAEQRVIAAAAAWVDLIRRESADHAVAAALGALFGAVQELRREAEAGA